MSAGEAARSLALRALVRIEDGGAYANLVVPALLDRSEFSAADRRLITDLVYGATRMRRACDHLVEPWLLRPVDPEVRAALRLGAYQLAFSRVPSHAAVATTVAAVRGPGRKLVNAVLRRVARALEAAPPAWPDAATELSYPDWILTTLGADLGDAAAREALEAMNAPASVTTRDDGYIQDRGSQLVAALVEAGPGQVVVDLCAAPGGKATLMASGGAAVVAAADLNPARVALIAANLDRLGPPASAVAAVVADAAQPPFRPGSADRVLLDAPCSGLGALRRRPDARWRASPEAVGRLAALQARLLAAALPLVRPGGLVVYAVCTMTRAEGPEVAAAVRWDGFELLPPPGPPWTPVEGGPGAWLLPQTEGTDGMYVLRAQRQEAS
jgi:16S rRNA (cytosine967-C5)-methyltransferase